MSNSLRRYPRSSLQESEMVQCESIGKRANAQAKKLKKRLKQSKDAGAVEDLSKILNTLRATDLPCQDTLLNLYGQRLKRVEKILNERQTLYGSASKMFSELSGAWSVSSGKNITPAMSAMMMVQLKIARMVINGPSKDSVDDAIGYLAIYGALSNV